ncbi:MAG: prepilin-type N-terminal cleavage/methylation domain-containing protein [Kosmotoga sp.]|uniref:prepilin-type N-terminal cleavage/methylation domain-containing protein n=1 Tax=Kosmotoga sp. TaxID=1955248 RepID=UPI001D25EC8E|nr:prepilin-type N-terminal cleavage/methylation domain-containing protein [Kosmotoga sp.]MBO8166629.1 prepilin-type N-terminal cleavage/methylation domain-containing protein [Kosmotoga sp.]
MRKGMTLAELLAALSISSIVILTILVLTVFFIRTSGRIMKSNILDEEATKLQTSLDYIISENWSAINSEEWNELSDKHTVPLIASVNMTPVATKTIFFVKDSRTLYYAFPDRSNATTTVVIAEHIEDIQFSIGGNTQWLTYDATLSYDGVIKRTHGAVRYF